MRFLLIDLPGHRHLGPSLGLAAALCAAGHGVEFLLPSAYASDVQDTGALHMPYQDGGSWLPTVRNAALLALERGKRADAILYGQAFFPGRALADKLGKPSVRICPEGAVDAISVQRFLAGPGVPAAWQWAYYRHRMGGMALEGVPMHTGDWGMELAAVQGGLNLAHTLPSLQPRQGQFGLPAWRFVGASGQRLRQQVFLPSQRATKPVVFATAYGAPKPLAFCQHVAQAFAACDVLLLLEAGAGLNSPKLPRRPGLYVYEALPAAAVLPFAALYITAGSGFGVAEAVWHRVPVLYIGQGGAAPGALCAQRGCGAALPPGAGPRAIVEAGNRAMYDAAIRGALAVAKQEMLAAGGSHQAARLVAEYAARRPLDARRG